MSTLLATGRTDGTEVRCPHCGKVVQSMSVRHVSPSGVVERNQAPKPHLRPDGLRCTSNIDTHGTKP